MRITFSIDECVVRRARRHARALGKNLDQLIQEYLLRLVADDDPERSIAEFKELSGQGNSRGCLVARDEIHARD